MILEDCFSSLASLKHTQVMHSTIISDEPEENTQGEAIQSLSRARSGGKTGSKEFRQFHGLA